MVQLQQYSGQEKIEECLNTLMGHPVLCPIRKVGLRFHSLTLLKCEKICSPRTICKQLLRKTELTTPSNICFSMYSRQIMHIKSKI